MIQSSLDDLDLIWYKANFLFSLSSNLNRLNLIFRYKSTFSKNNLPYFWINYCDSNEFLIPFRDQNSIRINSYSKYWKFGSEKVYCSLFESFWIQYQWRLFIKRFSCFFLCPWIHNWLIEFPFCFRLTVWPIWMRWSKSLPSWRQNCMRSRQITPFWRPKYALCKENCKWRTQK